MEEPETRALHDLVRGRHPGFEPSNPQVDPQAVFALLSFVELDADLARIAGFTGATELRALDAIHVASALRLGSEVDAFVTYDSRHAVAAGAAGLRVCAPGDGGSA